MILNIDDGGGSSKRKVFSNGDSKGFPMFLWHTPMNIILYYRIALHCIVLYCIVLYCILILLLLLLLYRIVLYCIVLYCIVLYCVVLYCIVRIVLRVPSRIMIRLSASLCTQVRHADHLFARREICKLLCWLSTFRPPKVILLALQLMSGQ